jgi:8-oxo-dGTP diphosphatase
VSIPEFGTRENGATYFLRPGAHVPIGLMLPGGGLDADETHEAAAIRETAEEIGVRVELLDTVAEADEVAYSNSEQRHLRKRVRFFTARIAGSAEKTEPDHELVWMHTTDALGGLAYGSHRWALEQWLARR